MTDFRERYKRVGFGREDVDVNRVLRSQQRDEARHNQRSEHYSLRRDLRTVGQDEDSFLEPEPVASQSKNLEHSSKESKKKTTEDIEIGIQQRLLELEKWQKERDRKKLEEKKRNKPVFKVGVVHHRIYSPPLNKEAASVPHQKLCKSRNIKQESEPPKRITRATEKRLAAKAVTNHQKREDKRNKIKVPTNNKVNKLQEVPFAPSNYQFTAPPGITPLPMFGRLAFKDIEKNMKFDNASTNVSSTTTEIGKNFCTSSDSVFSSNNKSFNSSKVISRRSNSRRSNVHKCDLIINENSRDLTTNNVEALTLKVSSDDQEMLKDHEEIEFSKINISLPKHMKSPARKRKATRTSINKPSQTMTIDEPKSVLQDQEIIDVQETNDKKDDSEAVKEINTVINRRILRGQRRSAKIIVNESPAKLKGASFVIEDKEILDNQQSVESTVKNANCTINTSSNESTYKNINNDIIEKSKNGMVSESPKLMNTLEIINSKLKNTVLDSPVPQPKIPKSSLRRSTRTPKSNSKKEVSKKILLNVPVNHEMNKPSDLSNNTSEVTEMKNSTALKLNNSLGIRKSSRFTKSKSEEETIETPMEQGSPHVKNYIIVESSISRQTRKSANIKKSTKVLNDENIPANLSTMEIDSVDDQELTIGRESVFDLQNKHLLDITLSDLNKLKSLKSRKTAKINNENLMDFENQSLIKFSPRQSLRHHNDESKQQQTTSSIKSPVNKATDKSIIKFDPLISKSNEKLNESTSSEPAKQKSPNSLNDSQNFSLNLTLPDESLTEKPPAYYSPYIVTSRGKNNIRKEMQKRRFSHRVDEDVPTKDTIMQSLNISVEEEERTAQYYKHILAKEIERLNERCDIWNAIKEAESTPEEIHYQIQAAVGHTQLLINKKFQRFHSLVLDCETGKGEMLVTCKDLQGFWDMMYMEIKDVDSRFDKLEDLKVKNWIEENETKQEESKPKKKAPAKKSVTKKKPAAKSSSLRALIMAARKKMENKESDMNIDLEVDVKLLSENKTQEKTEIENQKNKSTPKNIRFSATSKNLRQSLVNKLHNSSDRKRLPSSPLIAMKISQMCKTPEVQLDDLIIYINSDQTPAKSILKGKPKDDVNASHAKSKNKVFFKEQPMEVQEFPNYNDNYRSSCEFNEADKEPVERRLDFENDSFNAEDPNTPEKAELRHKSEYVVLSANPMIPLLNIKPVRRNRTPKVKKPISFDESKSTRILRSQAATKELYLNKDGVICERFVPVTPNPNLKRSNSERVTKNTRSNKTEESKTSATPVTPKPRRRTTKKLEVVLPDSLYPTHELLNSNKKNLLTPRNRKCLKRSTSELSESSEGTSTGSESSPIVKKTPKIIKTLNSTNINDGIEKTATPRLRRTKSLNITDGKNKKRDNSVKTPTSNLRRKNSRTKADVNEEFEKTIMLGVKRKSLKNA